MEYTMAQIKSMQQEATRRVQEMNRRAKNTAARSNPMPPEPERKPPEPESVPDAPVEPVSSKPPEPDNKPPYKRAPLDFLRSIDLKRLISGENSDQLLLLLLVMVLLADPNADDFLIYALIYIML